MFCKDDEEEPKTLRRIGAAFEKRGNLMKTWPSLESYTPCLAAQGTGYLLTWCTYQPDVITTTLLKESFLVASSC